tara:strand:- start:257 stop:709 length:453 start_codon:yes stop_codon:yes gene_type:complete
MTKIISIKTKFGWISASEYKKKIYKIRFGKSKKQNNSKILSVFKKNLTKFLNKKALKINSPYKIEGTKIQKKIWNELRKIKVGETRSYGSIAKKHKISPREVGKICSKNKLLLSIPCHRVIRSDGSIGGFTSLGGIKLKKKLLKFEQSWK